MALFEELLNHFNITKEGYEKLISTPSFSNIPLLNKDDQNVVKAKEIILDSIKTHKKILIYGDYDCDGIMSTSIICKSIKKLGGDVYTYIPSRYLDGYGLTFDNAKKIAQAHYGLVILVDNGIRAFEGINELNRNNVPVVIIDHHEIGEKLPEAYSIVHPDILKYGEYAISAGYLSFIFSIVLLNGVDDYLLCLGAISTLSDMMPLKGHNREILRLSLDLMNKHHYSPFLYLNDSLTMSYNSLSSNVIPAINAIGRVVEDTTINRLVSYFVEEDEKKLGSLSKWMKEINANRKELTKNAVNNLSLSKDDIANVLASSLPVGLNGLLANNILQKTNKPTVVFSESSKDKSILVGSVRSKTGMSVVDSFSALKEFIIESGGHELAGGVSIKSADFESFKKAFIQYCIDHPFTSGAEQPIEIKEDDLSIEMVELVQSFAPFGTEWKEPKFTIKNQRIDAIDFIKEGKIYCHRTTNNSKFLSFAISRDLINGIESIDLIGTVKLNEWKNSVTAEYNCELLK